MIRISQAIWKQVQQDCMALSHVAKHHTLQVNSKMIRHLTLSALVLASIPTSAVFVWANEMVAENQNDEKSVSAESATSKKSTNEVSNIVTYAEDTAAENDVHYISIKTNKTNAKNYNNDGATGTDSIVIGIGSTASGNNDTVLGNNNKIIFDDREFYAKGFGDYATVIGYNNTLRGDRGYGNNGIVVGLNTDVEGINNAVFGTDYHNGNNFRGTRVYGDQNTVIGLGNTVGYHVEKKNGTLNYTPYQDTKGEDQNVVVGFVNVVNGGGVVVGKSSSSGEKSLSAAMFGIGNEVLGDKNNDNDVALGNHLQVSGTAALAVGYKSVAKGFGTIAVGYLSSASDSAIAIGGAGYFKDENTGEYVLDGAGADGDYAIAIGCRAKATRDYTMALGRESSATKGNAVALGYKAMASESNGVALGASSVANVKAGMPGFDPVTLRHPKDDSNDLIENDPIKEPSIDYKSSAWTSTLGAVSVGYAPENGKQQTRQIINVAAGTLDTDAVNVAQLKRAMQESEDDRKNLRGLIEKYEKKWSTDTDTKITGVSLKYNKDTKSLTVELRQNDADTITGNTTLEGILSTDSGLTQDTKNTVVAGDHIEVDSTKPNDFGGTEYKISVKVDGKVEKGNTGLVSGGTIYNETRVEEDGNYVQKSNTAGENLTALDTQVKRNADSIISLGDTVYDLSNRVGEMDDRINKVGAGAAALAALHPLDYDPEDKWDIAAGFGNYKNASAGALGLFYRPNERTQFNVGWTMGDDRNMFNAGFSVKLGQGSSYAGYSKADMAQLITKQKDEIAALQATIGEQEKEIQQIEEKMNALMARLEKNK